MDALRKMTLMPAQRLEKRVPAMREKGRLRGRCRHHRLPSRDRARCRDLHAAGAPLVGDTLRSCKWHCAGERRKGAGRRCGRKGNPRSHRIGAGNPSRLRLWVSQRRQSMSTSATAFSGKRHRTTSFDTVRIHQCESHCGAGPTTTHHLRRHQEEGTGRQLQERRNRLSPQRRSAARQRARLRGQEARQGRALWGVRCDHQHREVPPLRPFLQGFQNCGDQTAPDSTPRRRPCWCSAVSLGQRKYS